MEGSVEPQKEEDLTGDRPRVKSQRTDGPARVRRSDTPIAFVMGASKAATPWGGNVTVTLQPLAAFVNITIFFMEGGLGAQMTQN